MLMMYKHSATKLTDKLRYWPETRLLLNFTFPGFTICGSLKLFNIFEIANGLLSILKNISDFKPKIWYSDFEDRSTYNYVI